MQSINTLMTAIVDYAGLFPPAKLDMSPAVRNFAEYVAGDDAWMLARLIIPVARLDEFEREAVDLLPTSEEQPLWRISALSGGETYEELQRDLERIDAFNRLHADPEAGLAHIDTIELKASSSGQVDACLELIPDDLRAFFEISWREDPRGLIAALAGSGAGAKVRTGGVTPDLIPPPEALARFLCACAASEVPFKATAGLHHPFRNEDREVDAMMHGFVNVFLGAAFISSTGMPQAGIVDLLKEESPAAFQFDDHSATWRRNRISVEEILESRSVFAISFGSCSFDEPRDDLHALRLL